LQDIDKSYALDFEFILKEQTLSAKSILSRHERYTLTSQNIYILVNVDTFISVKITPIQNQCLNDFLQKLKGKLSTDQRNRLRIK